MNQLWMQNDKDLIKHLKLNNKHTYTLHLCFTSQLLFEITTVFNSCLKYLIYYRSLSTPYVKPKDIFTLICIN